MCDVGARALSTSPSLTSDRRERNNWPKLPQVIERAAAAAARGVEVTAASTRTSPAARLWAPSSPPGSARRRPRGGAGGWRPVRPPASGSAASFVDASRSPDNFWKWSGPEGILIADFPPGSARTSAA